MLACLQYRNTPSFTTGSGASLQVLNVRDHLLSYDQVSRWDANMRHGVPGFVPMHAADSGLASRKPVVGLGHCASFALASFW